MFTFSVVPSTSAQLAIGGAALAAPTSANLPMFATEDVAQKHCPKDTVVWLNIPSGIYHLKGERWYGRTKHGDYVCQKEADAAGDRETENGQ
jgi:hypothetical protein